ncbi:MAG: FAD-dependent monooxygenase, partial [Flavobacterium sp.]
MPTSLLLQVSPEIASNEVQLRDFVSKKMQVASSAIQHISISKRSIDARQKSIKINLKLDVYLVGEDFTPSPIQLPEYQYCVSAPEVIIIGAGPAGLFAALQLLELGIKPIVIERGKDVRGRRRDLKAINVDHVVNEDSNYCFGEGGAGTYSDGK